jgi:multiple sugar transport system permease protein
MKPMKNSTKEAVAAYGFLLPNLVGFLIFTSIPVIASLGLSFTRWDLLSGPPKFVGLANFIEIFREPLFWKYCWNTIYMMLSIPLSMGGSLILALAMNQKLKGILFFRTVYFLPTLCSGVAIYMLWRLIYNPDFGIFAPQALTARSWYQIDNTKTDELFNKLVDDVNFNRATIRDALSSAQNQINVIMKKSQ